MGKCNLITYYNKDNMENGITYCVFMESRQYLFEIKMNIVFYIANLLYRD